MATFGYTTIGATAGATAADNMQMFKWILGTAATVSSMTVYTSVVAGTATYKCAIYRVSDMSLVAQTDVGTNLITTTPGWSTVNFTPAVYLRADYYWLVLWTDFAASNISYYYDNRTNEGAFKALAFGSWPDPLTALGGTGTRQLSLYATYTAEGTLSSPKRTKTRPRPFAPGIAR